MPRGKIITVRIPDPLKEKDKCTGEVKALESEGEIEAGHTYHYRHTGNCCGKKPDDEVSIDPPKVQDGTVKIKCY